MSSRKSLSDSSLLAFRQKTADQAVADENVGTRVEGTPVKGRLSLTRGSVKRRSSSSSSEGSDGESAKTSKTSKTPKVLDVFSYDPSSSSYNCVKDAVWGEGDDVPYLAFAKTLEKIEAVPSRLKMIEILSNYLASVLILSPKDAVASVYLCLNKLAPDYEGLELGVGESLIMKAVAEATGRTMEHIKADVEKQGDIGDVAVASRSHQRCVIPPPKLYVRSVFEKLREVAQMTGHASAAKKAAVIRGLIVSCRDCEARYLVRSLSGKLRIGLAEQSLLAALGQAVALFEEPSLKRKSDKFQEIADKTVALLKVAYCECPNYDKILSVVLTTGSASLPEHCKLTPGVPLKPMLAHPTKGIEEVLRRFENSCFTCEYKYDGERAQIHLTSMQETHVFSRNQENNTTKYPDIVSCITDVKKEEVSSFIIDTEAVAWDRESKKILPFQVLSTRKRKDVKEEDIRVRVCVFAFDILYLNGESLTREPLRRRRELLRQSFKEQEGVFMFAQGSDVSTTEEIQELVDVAVKDRCEGLMVKCLDDDATYEIAKRSHNWLKVKKDYLEGVGDSLDVVVIGGWMGKGKRAGAYGGFLLACYDPESEEFQTICKIGTGFSDEDLEAHTAFLKQHVIPEAKSYYNWDEGVKPDVWFEAVQVWEVKCADLSISPVHRAAVGRVDESRGISLRFPRFLRIRDDKKVEDATSAEQVALMYANQESVKNKEDADSAHED